MSKIYSLTDTLSMMLSDDYKERFLAEYIQVCVRLNKLTTIVDQFEAGTLPFKPSCPIELLKKQMVDMNKYRNDLEKRVMYEDIELPSALYIR